MAYYYGLLLWLIIIIIISIIIIIIIIIIMIILESTYSLLFTVFIFFHLLPLGKISKSSGPERKSWWYT